MLSHFTGYCHFIGNTGATSLEGILSRKLPLQWKQPKSYNHLSVVAYSSATTYYNFSDLLRMVIVTTPNVTTYIMRKLLCQI